MLCWGVPVVVSCLGAVKLCDEFCYCYVEWKTQEIENKLLWPTGNLH